MTTNTSNTVRSARFMRLVQDRSVAMVKDPLGQQAFCFGYMTSFLQRLADKLPAVAAEMDEFITHMEEKQAEEAV
jgi:hypothetical protein